MEENTPASGYRYFRLIFPPRGGVKEKSHWKDILDMPGVEYSKDKLHVILPLNAKAHQISLVSDHI